MEPYSGDTKVIAKVGTTPEDRGLETEDFKAKFDEGLTAFVQWFNTTHRTEFEAHLEDMVMQLTEITLTGYFNPGTSNTNYVNYNKVTKMCELNAFLIRSIEIVGGAWTDTGFITPHKPSQTITFVGMREGGSDSPIVENIKCRITPDGKLWVLVSSTVSGATQYKIRCCFYAS